MAYYGLEELDARIAEHVTAARGTFVELGAYDGVNQNNTLHFEERGWRGVLIEPLPDAYTACVRNRPLAKVFNCACVARDDLRSSVPMTEVGLMSVVNGVMGDPDREASWIARGERVQGIQRRDVVVPARTLDDVLVEAGLPKPDLLVLDVEGAEVEVLRGLDLSRHRPRFIVCEDAYTAGAAHLLRSSGYSLKTILLERPNTRDVLYVDETLS